MLINPEHSWDRIAAPSLPLPHKRGSLTRFPSELATHNYSPVSQKGRKGGPGVCLDDQEHNLHTTKHLFPRPGHACIHLVFFFFYLIACTFWAQVLCQIPWRSPWLLSFEWEFLWNPRFLGFVNHSCLLHFLLVLEFFRLCLRHLSLKRSFELDMFVPLPFSFVIFVCAPHLKNPSSVFSQRWCCLPFVPGTLAFV